MEKSIFEEALHKSNANMVNILGQVGFDETADVLEKGKKAQVGEIRDWHGVKMQKTSQGWKPVKGQFSSKEDRDSLFDWYGRPVWNNVEAFYDKNNWVGAINNEILRFKKLGDPNILSSIADKVSSKFGLEISVPSPNSPDYGDLKHNGYKLSVKDATVPQIQTFFDALQMEVEEKSKKSEIDSLDIDGFCEYLKTQFKPHLFEIHLCKNRNEGHFSRIDIPCLRTGSFVDNLSISYKSKLEIDSVSIPYKKGSFEELKSLFSDNFRVYHKKGEFPIDPNRIKIKTKGSKKFTNESVIDILRTYRDMYKDESNILH